MRQRSGLLVTAAFVAALSSACSRRALDGAAGVWEDLQPTAQAGPQAVEEVLQTAMGAAHAATLAFAALEEEGSCAAVVSGCAEAGCGFQVEIDVGQCPVPFVTEGGSGVVVVAGVRTGPDSAIIDAQYGRFEIGGRRWFVAGIGAMVAERHGDRVTIVYAQQEVEIGTGLTAASAELEQHVWTTDVLLAGTPADTGDDVYTVTGALQEAGVGQQGASLVQAAIALARIEPSCRRNPVSGSAFVERLAAGSSLVVSLLSMGFHPACDGRAEILSAIGTDMFSVGGTVPMDLLD